MSHFKHHAIAVTSLYDPQIEEAHKKAIAIFSGLGGNVASLVSPILPSTSNGFRSFFIVPDGSKEGWARSNDCDKARGLFLDWLAGSHTNFCEYVEVEYGFSEIGERIVRGKHSDLSKEEY